MQKCSGYDTVDFSLKASAGNCLIKQGEPENGPLNIFGNPDLDKVNPSFRANIDDNTCKVNLSLQDFKTTSLSDGIFFAMLGGANEMENNLWKILFDTEKVYKLDLDYGFGMADVNLDGTLVKGMKIRSGSADVLVDYEQREPNPIAMDTFLVKVDMGSLVAKNVDCANAEHVIADIGFGRALLDLGQARNRKCMVQATVGAGNLDIFLPAKDVPIIIHIKDSPFCGVQILEGFEQVEKNVFVNMDYSATAPNLLTFDLDVALGKVVFHYAE
ncbi:hypothetical protein [Marinoscillum sp. MHG1-6]|uniref:hypothetical protein n=1 Tax=Marinoscillum sp. MHG1-6 TaxID=2959627 RepID=UPI0021573256|nr:hypothetical protein [Marinoscillum sp. MHG1-6]